MCSNRYVSSLPNFFPVRKCNFFLGSVFSLISSVHTNKKEDRVWSASCLRKVTQTKIGLSVWTYYTNDWRGFMKVECPDGNVIAGISSTFSNYDRRYKFQCTFVTGWQRGPCHQTPYTAYDADWSFQKPKTKYLVGVASHFSSATG